MVNVAQLILVCLTASDAFKLNGTSEKCPECRNGTNYYMCSISQFPCWACYHGFVRTKRGQCKLADPLPPDPKDDGTNFWLVEPNQVMKVQAIHHSNATEWQEESSADLEDWYMGVAIGGSFINYDIIEIFPWIMYGQPWNSAGVYYKEKGKGRELLYQYNWNIRPGRSWKEDGPWKNTRGDVSISCQVQGRDKGFEVWGHLCTVQLPLSITVQVEVKTNEHRVYYRGAYVDPATATLPAKHLPDPWHYEVLPQQNLFKADDDIGEPGTYWIVKEENGDDKVMSIQAAYGWNPPVKTRVIAISSSFIQNDVIRVFPRVRVDDFGGPPSSDVGINYQYHGEFLREEVFSKANKVPLGRDGLVFENTRKDVHIQCGGILRMTGHMAFNTCNISHPGSGLEVIVEIFDEHVDAWVRAEKGGRITDPMKVQGPSVSCADNLFPFWYGSPEEQDTDPSWGDEKTSSRRRIACLTTDPRVTSGQGGQKGGGSTKGGAGATKGGAGATKGGATSKGGAKGKRRR
ncbi:unnamed protein product [Symbiodinium natans]|uniref:Uncharacterized protein n=1 Tax=Symbiodinium natans TaxID=878477 RepID=A0A812I3V0_9DINO|nr:unnamed protein product [Symbiodinium natans]